MRALTILFVLFFLCANSLFGAEDMLHLSIGDPSRKDREATLVLDGITDTVTGEIITTAGLAERLQDTRIIFVGEHHTNMASHFIELRVIQELKKRNRPIIIGLEMYPVTEQLYLDEWNKGFLSEKGFVSLSRWYENWGYNWNYYRDIFLFARDNGIPMAALNAPRKIVSKVMEKGIKNLAPDEASFLPPVVNTESAEHRRLIAAIFAGSGGIHSSLSNEHFDRMFAAQCTWDACMGYNAVQTLKNNKNDSAIVVVLIGEGHVAYNLGIMRQAALWFEGKMSSLCPVHVTDGDSKAVCSVRASYSDFIWGIPGESEPAYPELGISVRGNDGGLEVINVGEGSCAAKGGMKKGDLLILMDGIDLRDMSILKRLVAEKKWSDSAVITLKRGNDNIVITVNFRRASSCK